MLLTSAAALSVPSKAAATLSPAGATGDTSVAVTFDRWPDATALNVLYADLLINIRGSARRRSCSGTRRRNP